MTNQYHKDDSVNEVLKLLDNAHDIYRRKLNCTYATLLKFRALYKDIEQEFKEEIIKGEN